MDKTNRPAGDRIHQAPAGRGGQRADESRPVRQPVAQQAAGNSHTDRPPRFAKGDFGPQDTGPVLTLEGDHVSA